MQYSVPLVPQTTSMSCWAASIVMILSWRNQASFDPSLLAQNSGGTSYAHQFQHGLNPNDVYILNRYGLVVEAPRSYNMQAFYDMLARHGPLWVAGATFPQVHVRVVTGMDLARGRVHINDPWQRGMRNFRPGNRGSRYTISYGQFMNEVGGLAGTELGEPRPVYVAHMP